MDYEKGITRSHVPKQWLSHVDAGEFGSKTCRWSFGQIWAFVKIDNESTNKIPKSSIARICRKAQHVIATEALNLFFGRGNGDILRSWRVNRARRPLSAVRAVQMREKPRDEPTSLGSNESARRFGRLTKIRAENKEMIFCVAEMTIEKMPAQTNALIPQSNRILHRIRITTTYFQTPPNTLHFISYFQTPQSTLHFVSRLQ